MPIHDWTRVPAGTYHFFHQRWIQDIAAALNTGGLPPGYFAMSEVTAGGPIADVFTVQDKSRRRENGPTVGVAVLDAPPRAAVVSQARDTARYAARADRLSIYLAQGKLVAVIEILSPGNKDRVASLKTFVRKAHQLLRKRVHLLVVDLHPPTPRDPEGVHPAIWEHYNSEPFTLPPGRPLTLAAYAAGRVPVAYVQPVGVGEPLPDMPLFLSPGRYVPCPLEATYQESWRVFPAALKALLG